MSAYNFVYESIYRECKKEFDDSNYCKFLAKEALSAYNQRRFTYYDLVKLAVDQAKKQAKIHKAKKGLR